MCPSTQYHKGFTLIEVLVAILIISITFSAFYYTLASSIRNQTIVSATTQATWIAENFLNSHHIGIVQFPTNKNRITQKFSFGKQVFQLEATKKTTQNSKIYKIDVIVTVADGQTVGNLTGYFNDKS